MRLFGFFEGDVAKIDAYLKKGAVVIDVRTPMEYNQAHAPGSELIPLDAIPQNVARIQEMNKAVILVCRTGARAGSAKRFLQRFGIDVINGGAWQAVVQES